MAGTATDSALIRATRAVHAANAAAGSVPRHKIGILTPLTDTGWVVAGEMMVRGACLAADYIRERGGIRGGEQLELVLEDDQLTAAREPMWRSAVGGMAKLAIVDDVLAVLGQWHVRTTPWVVELSHRLGVPHFVTTGHPEVTTRRYRTVFRTFYTITERADIMVRFMKAHAARRVAIIAANSLFGKMFADAVEAMAAASPAACEVLRIDYDQETATNVQIELQRIKAWKPDFLVNLGIMVRMDAYSIINQAGAVGLFPGVPMLVGIPFPNASTEFWRRCGANGELIVWPTSAFRPGWPGLTPTGRWFADRYTATYGAFPSEMALTAFTDVAIIAQALDQAGSSDRDALIAALERGTFDSWRGPIHFERHAEHWHHSPAAVQLLQYHTVGDTLGQAKVVYPPALCTGDYLPTNAVPARRTLHESRSCEGDADKDRGPAADTTTAL